MKQLTVLELRDIRNLTDEHMITLAKGLGLKLEQLQLGGSTAKNLTMVGLKKMLPFTTKLSLLTIESKKITIGADDYEEMLSTLKKRPKPVKLRIELTARVRGQVQVNEQVQNENRYWFYIEERYQD